VLTPLINKHVSICCFKIFVSVNEFHKYQLSIFCNYLPKASHTEYQQELEKLFQEFKRDKILVYSHSAVRPTPVISFIAFLFEYTVCIVVPVYGYIPVLKKKFRNTSPNKTR
jgi:hypothetical protein